MAVDVFTELVPEPEAAMEARRSLDRLSGAVPAGLLDDLRLVVTEIVTNVVVHTDLTPEHDRIILSVIVEDRRVEGVVCDTGAGYEPPENPSPREDLSGGWGLYIVDKLCDDWGVGWNGLFCVWFEMGRK
jgi:anti-sigma regulatory factor (Ser/Thr protein kinase)